MAETNDSIPTPSTRLMVPGVILAVLISVGTLRGPSLISSDGIGSALIVVAPLILATYALTAIVMAGRAGVDLSIGPLIGFINVGMIKLLEAGVLESPISVFLYAMAVGVAYQLLLGLIIVYVRVQPIIVSLSGYLSLVGLNLLIMPRPGGVAPDWMMTWGGGTAIFTPVLAIVVIATLGWYVMARTAFFGHLRLMGSDERAAYTSGVKINVVRLGAHCIAGIYAGLAAICFTALISSGDPTQGTTFTLMAITALVLGGASLSGGRGGATGSLLGALNIYLITYVLATFNFGTVQSYVTDLSYGTMLVASLLTNSALPQIQRAVRTLSPTLVFAILLSIAGSVVVHATIDAGGKLGHGAAALSNPAVSGVGPAGAALPAGSVIMLVIIGLVALGYLATLLVRHSGPPLVALVVVGIIIGLGLIFNGHDAGSAAPAASPATTTIEAYQLDMTSLDGIVHQPTLGGPATPLTGFAVAVFVLLGVVMLVSVIVVLNLFDAQAMSPATSRGLVLAALGLGALVLVALAWTGGSETSTFGRQGLALAATAAILFVLLWSPLQFRLKRVANLYIIVLGVLAFGLLYFSAAAPADQRAAGSTVNGIGLRAAMAMKPAVMPEPTMTTRLEPAVHSSRRFAPVVGLSYAVLIGLALQFALWLAFRGRISLRGAVSFGYIVAGTALAWSSLFYVSGASLTLIAVTLAAATLTAPLVWRAFDSYAKSFERHDGLVEARSVSVGAPGAKRRVQI